MGTKATDVSYSDETHSGASHLTAPTGTTMADKTLNDLFAHQLKDTYFAENAILKAMPKMMDAATSADLKSALGVHLEETKNQVRRLDEVFDIIGAQPEGIECKAILGIIAEGDEVMEEFAGSDALDAGLIAAAQAVEHYEITRYGTLYAWANQLGLENAATLLKETLIEEENTDDILSDLAETSVNAEASD